MQYLTRHNPDQYVENGAFFVDDDVIFPTLEKLKSEPDYPGDPCRSFDKYEIINDWDSFLGLVADLGKASVIAADVESNGLGKLTHRVCGYSFSYRQDFGCLDHVDTRNVYVPVRHRTGELCLDAEKVAESLRLVFLRTDVVWIFWFAKFDLHHLLNEGIKVAGLVIDAMVYRKVLYPAKRSGLKFVATHELGATSNQWQVWVKFYIRLLCRLNGWRIPSPNSPLSGSLYDYVPVGPMAQYSGRDTRYTWMLASQYLSMLKERPRLLKVAIEEQNLVLPLFEVERNGIEINKKAVRDGQKRMQEVMDTIAADLLSFGFKGSLSNDADVISYLLSKEVPLVDVTRGTRKLSKDRQVFSLNEKVFMELKLSGYRKVIEPIHRWRQANDVLSCYLNQLEDYVESDGRIHATFFQMGAETARMSTTSPNLHSIIKRGEFAPLVLDCYQIPETLQELGWRWVFADLSQIEIRVAAHYSQEPNLVKAFFEERDVHTETAIMIFGTAWSVASDSVQKKMRAAAKALNFGIIYGIQATGLKNMLLKRGIKYTEQECRSLIISYKLGNKILMGWIEDMKRLVCKQGYTENLYGRLRDFSFLSDASMPDYIRDEKELEAINWIFQSTAADFFKRGWSRMVGEFKSFGNGQEALPNNCVHDETQYLVSPAFYKPSKKIASRIFEKDLAGCFSVPIRLNFSESLSTMRHQQDV